MHCVYNNTKLLNVEAHAILCGTTMKALKLCESQTGSDVSLQLLLELQSFVVSPSLSTCGSPLLAAITVVFQIYIYHIHQCVS
jgi:hypothetical protein